MKLSEAIREGIKLGGRQIVGNYLEFDEEGRLVGSCALGGAALAWGLDIEDDGWYDQALEEKVHEFLRPRLDQSAIRQSLGYEVVDANDDGMTREEIADRLEKAGL